MTDVLGFSEYQGSLREENIDGEPRFFRTFWGPADSRQEFLRFMFGAMFFDTLVTPDCIRLCANPQYYPVDDWSCGVPYPPGQVVVPTEYQMIPVSYRVQPLSDKYAGTKGTEETIGQTGLSPDIECGVLVEIEYRRGILTWPDAMHDPTYVSITNTSPAEYKPDVPYISAPTWIEITHEMAIEARTLKGRTMEVCTYGTITPAESIPVGAQPTNQITSDDIEPFTTVNIHTFVITLHNVPYVKLDWVRNIMGKVNNDVWFGYPAHAVCCTEIRPTLKASITNTLYYDLEFTFVARFVPANGEEEGDLMPVRGVGNGKFVHNGVVGVWNRAWWEHPAVDGANVTTQHWWPITENGLSDLTATEPWADQRLPIPEVNFHTGFHWWRDICNGSETFP